MLAAETFPDSGGLVAIGVGPGDPELITLKGVRLLQAADVVITPVGDRSGSSVAYSIVADHIDPDRQQVLQRVFPMRQPAEQLASAGVNLLAVQCAISIRVWVVHAGSEEELIPVCQAVLVEVLIGVAGIP